MTSKASRRKDTADVLRNIKKEKRNLNSANRKIAAGTGPVALGAVSTNMGVSVGSNNNIQFFNGLSVAGGVMMGPLAYNPQEKTISGGTLTLTDITTILNPGTSLTIVAGEGSSADDLVNISGASYNGQILLLQANLQEITLKTTGNIHTNDNADVVLSAYNSGASTGGEVATLIYDDTVTGGNWVVFNVGGGGSGGWVGTAASDLDMATYDINLNGNELFMDADADTSIYSTADDTLTFMVGASVKLTMTNTQILFANDVTLLGGFADLNVGSNTINFLVTGQTIDSTASGITYNVPTSDSHYFAVNGVTALQIGATDTTHYNNVKPASTLTYDLGSSSRRYRYIYALQIVDLSALTMDGTIKMEGNMLEFDTDNDTYIESSTDDNLQFFAGGSVKLNINNSNALFTTDISMVTGTTVDFTDTGTPTGAGGYFKVKVGGVEKYVPYYS